MDLRQLEYFTAIADAGSISEAARRLHISQPPLSAQMKLLEKETGAVLFTRSVHGIHLTDAGRIVYRYGQQMLQQRTALLQEIEQSGKSETLHLGLTPTTMPLVAPLLGKLAALDPAIRYEIHDGNTFELLDLLDTGVIDAAVLRSPISETSTLSLQLIRHDTMLAVSTEPLSEKITLRKLSSLPLILYRRYQDLTMSAFNDAGLKPNIFAVCDNARTSIALARSSHAAAIIPSSMEQECEGLKKAVISSKKLNTDILLARPDKQQNAMVDHLAQLFQ